MILSFIFSFSIALADLNGSSSFNVRTKPVGGMIDSTLAYDYRIWGQDKILSGYVRPSMRLGTIGVTHQAGVSVEVFPISFVGVKLGRSLSYRLVDSPAHDCQTVACQGMIDATTLAVPLLLGYQNFFWLNHFKVEWWNGPNAGQDFLENFTALVGTGGQDRLTQISSIAGFTLGEDKLGGVFIRSAFEKSQGYQWLGLGIWQRKWGKVYGEGNWTSTLGMGATQAPATPFGALLTLGLEYKWGETLAL